MKVVAFSGSTVPAKTELTGILLNVVLSELSREGIETELVQLAGQPLQGSVPPKCFKKDGMCAVDKVLQRSYAKMRQADGLIIGSPTYFSECFCRDEGPDRAGRLGFPCGQLLAETYRLAPGLSLPDGPARSPR